MNSPQMGVTAAFLVIGVLIAAKHISGTSGITQLIAWLKAPVGQQKP